MICSSIARMRSSSSHDSSGAQYENISTLSNWWTRKCPACPCRTCRPRAEARRVARVTRRQHVGREGVAAVQGRERHLTRTDEEQLAVVDVVDLGAIGREEPSLLHRALAHECGRDHRRETVLDHRRHRVVDERELEQRGLAHDVGESRTTRLGRACRVDESDRLGERGVIERRVRGSRHPRS